MSKFKALVNITIDKTTYIKGVVYQINDEKKFLKDVDVAIASNPYLQSAFAKVETKKVETKKVEQPKVETKKKVKN